MEPIQQFPPHHPYVKQGICGVERDSVVAIPESGDYFGSCHKHSGAEIFYSYSWPDWGASANTGYEEDDVALMYFVVDDSDNLYFTLVLDKPGNQGGDFTVVIDSPDLIDKAVSIPVRDDPRPVTDVWDACVNRNGDCYAWSDSEGRGSMSWSWAACCTDGMTFGPMPSTDFCFNIRAVFSRGIDHVRMGTSDSGDGKLDTRIFSMEEIFSGLTICGETCEKQCSKYTFQGCGACTADENCTWCSGVERCMSRYGEESCPLSTTPINKGDCCPTCTRHETYSSCLSEPDVCSWCFETATCMTHYEGVENCSECNLWMKDGNDVPQLPHGAIDEVGNAVDAETVPVYRFCNGRGAVEPDHSCSCEEGFYGLGCENECTSDCGFSRGRGYCDPYSGQCVCTCGWMGDSCSTTGASCNERCENILVEHLSLDHRVLHTITCGTELAGPNGYEIRGRSSTCSGRLQLSGTDTYRCDCYNGFFTSDSTPINSFWAGVGVSPGVQYCDKRCPGIEVDGAGASCGTGTCENGECVCPPCHVGGGQQVCVDMDAVTCNDNRAKHLCDAMTGQLECWCGGQLFGQDCDECRCVNGRCNSVTGTCICDTGWFGEKCDSDSPPMPPPPPTPTSFPPPLANLTNPSDDSMRREGDPTTGDLAGLLLVQGLGIPNVPKKSKSGATTNLAFILTPVLILVFLAGVLTVRYRMSHKRRRETTGSQHQNYFFEPDDPGQLQGRPSLLYLGGGFRGNASSLTSQELNFSRLDVDHGKHMIENPLANFDTEDCDSLAFADIETEHILEYNTTKHDGKMAEYTSCPIASQDAEQVAEDAEHTITSGHTQSFAVGFRSTDVASQSNPFKTSRLTINPITGIAEPMTTNSDNNNV